MEQSGADFVGFPREALEQSITSRFQQQVERHSARLALKSRNRRCSYAELNREANRVARALLSVRGEAEEPVALFLEPGVAAITATLGVLKAGKFYVTLDPSHPLARSEYLLGDSRAPVVLSDTRHLPLAAELAGDRADVINLDDIGEESGADLELQVSPDAIAYLQYTSGSTGQPKGVIQNHRNVLHSVLGYTNGFRIRPADRLSPVRNVFVALLNGAAVYPFNVKEQGVADLGAWLADQEITIYSSIPSVFRQFAESLTGERAFPALRLIHLEGEPVTRRDVELCRRHFPRDCVLVNRLAATETGSIRWFFVGPETRIQAGMVPAGYPVDDKRVHLLGEGGAEVEPGQVGEIAVTSRYLSLGYWQRPDLTGEVFRSSAAGNGERTYLTGDLGRMLPDGCLEYLGRKDFQVKVRGNRIEVAEIELALLDHFPGLKDVVVIAREDRPNDQWLVAYLVGRGGPMPSTGELRACLGERLPAYMVPSAFVILEALPRTPSGKVDRRALPVPDLARCPETNGSTGPRTASEAAVARIWAEVFGVEEIGVTDDFLEAGGHSLLAMQIASRVRAAFQVDVPIWSILAAGTVEHVAALIDRAEEEAGGAEARDQW